MDHFIKEHVCFFLDRQSGNHLFLFFCIYFFRQCVDIAFQHALTSIIERKLSWQVMHVLNFPLSLDLTICMQMTLERPWVK